MSDDTLLVVDVDGVRTITINRPEVKNALTAAIRARFCALIEDTDADDAIPRRSSPRSTRCSAPASTSRRWPRASGSPAAANPVRRSAPSTKPVVCAVNGACVTGALELALSCTFIVASERARFAETTARLDVVAAWGLTALLPRAVGVRKAAELSITGNFVGADEALRIGLVNHVVPHDDLLPFTRALAEIARPSAVRPSSTSTTAATACRSPTRSRSRPRTPRHRASTRPHSGPRSRHRVAASVHERRLDPGPGRRRRDRVHPRRGLLPRQLQQDRQAAGVTWGVIQYHFGTREALMLAVHDRGSRSSTGRSPARSSSATRSRRASPASWTRCGRTTGAPSSLPTSRWCSTSVTIRPRPTPPGRR